MLQPVSTKYREFLVDEQRFMAAVRFTTKEFHDLVDDVRDAMLEARDPDARFTEAANAVRRSRAGKYTVEERLFVFLVWLKEYPTFASLERQMGGSKGGLRADCYWLRRRLSRHPALEEEVQWPSEEERRADRQLMLTAGLIAGFDDCVFAVDGTKDLSKRARIYEEQEKDYSANKGHGRSHSLYVNLRNGKPIRAEAGHEGRHVRLQHRHTATSTSSYLVCVRADSHFKFVVPLLSFRRMIAGPTLPVKSTSNPLAFSPGMRPVSETESFVDRHALTGRLPDLWCHTTGPSLLTQFLGLART
jgi:hypothetical protein